MVDAGSLGAGVTRGPVGGVALRRDVDAWWPIQQLGVCSASQGRTQSRAPSPGCWGRALTATAGLASRGCRSQCGSCVHRMQPAMPKQVHTCMTCFQTSSAPPAGRGHLHVLQPVWKHPAQAGAKGCLHIHVDPLACRPLPRLTFHTEGKSSGYHAAQSSPCMDSATGCCLP